MSSNRVQINYSNELSKYDPVSYPRMPKGKFDTITCNYVLNVVPIEEEAKIISSVYRRLKKGGSAYFSVRRGLKAPE